MEAFRFKLTGQNELIVGGAEADIIDGGKGKDILFGGDGADTYAFRKGDGSDIVLGFESGTDKLEVHSSIKQISLKDTPEGLEVYYSTFGQSGPDHFLLVGVHHVSQTDFIF